MTPETEEDAGEEEEVADRTKIGRWADGCNELGSFWRLIDSIQTKRRDLNADEIEFLKDMDIAFGQLSDGNFPSDTYELQLSLEQRFPDSSGRRIYTLRINGESVRAECYGSEWARDVGSDSWSGPTFVLSPEYNESNGDIYSFVAEFEDAITNRNFDLELLLNDDPVARLPPPHGSSEGALIVARLVRTMVRELQDMDDSSMLTFGDGSGLVNTWEEVCVQCQREHSFAWPAYEETLRALVAGTIEELLPADWMAAWLLTDAGEEWESLDPPHPKPCLDPQDVIEMVFNKLIETAADYSNPRIKAYLERPTD